MVANGGGGGVGATLNTGDAVQVTHVGCGIGSLTSRPSSLGKRNSNPRIAIQQLDACTSPFAIGTFDVRQSTYCRHLI